MREFKLIIAGGRDFDDYGTMEYHVDLFRMKYGLDKDDVKLIIVSGGAIGADALGERYARMHRLQIEEHKANWELNGRSAGPIRNRKMASIATHCICFWDGESSGTRSMINEAKAKNLPVKVIRYD